MNEDPSAILIVKWGCQLFSCCWQIEWFYINVAIFSLNRLLFTGQPKRHLLTTGWSVFVSAKRLVAGDSVLFIWFVPLFQCCTTKKILMSRTYPFPTNLGMRKTSFCLESDAPAVHRLWCPLLFFRVTACTLGSLQQQLMLLQQTAASQFSIILGNLNCLISKWQLYVSYVPLDSKNVLAGQVRQNLLYPFRNTSRLFFTRGYQLGCDSGCCLRLRNLVSAGEAAVPKFPSDSCQKNICPWDLQFYAQEFRKKLINKVLNNCRYMGTITEVSDADPVRWPSSYWRSVKVKVFSSPFLLLAVSLVPSTILLFFCMAFCGARFKLVITTLLNPVSCFYSHFLLICSSASQANNFVSFTTFRYFALPRFSFFGKRINFYCGISTT